MKLETLLVRAGGESDPATGALAPPLHLSTTFEHEPAGEAPLGFTYIRTENPTQSRLETALAAIEGGATALAFASGMAAGAAYLQSLPPGSHVLFHRDIYFGFRQLAQDYFGRWGLSFAVVDMTDVASVRAALTPETRLLWLETPSNPGLDILDIAALAQIAHEAGAHCAVDATFATPVLQQSLQLGADVVLHAATKYLGGHSDVQGGALIFARTGETADQARSIRTLLGAVMSPFNAWLILRGLRSLSCRMERHTANALELARRLDSHPAIEQVLYPGLPSHPTHYLAQRQMRGAGGMISVLVAGDAARTLEVAARFNLFVNATSLGGVESLVEHRASIEGPASAVPANLLRVSVGLEAVDDLHADWEQALS